VTRRAVEAAGTADRAARVPQPLGILLRRIPQLPQPRRQWAILTVYQIETGAKSRRTENGKEQP
jgi:hypothetical protein